MNKITNGLLVCFLILIVACKQDFQRPSWDMDIVAPFAKSEIGLKDLLSDTLFSIDSTGDKNLISLQYSQVLAGLSLDTLLSLPDTSNQASVNLNKLTIDALNIKNRTSLGDLAKADPDVNTYISFSKIIPLAIPSFGPVKTTDIVVNLQAYFQTLELLDALFVMDIKNDFPVDFTDIVFTLRNKGDNSIVYSDTIPFIARRSSFYKEKHLGEKTIASDLIGSYEFYCPGRQDSTFKADTSWAITTNGTIKDIKIKAAKAKFPAQDVITDANVNSYALEQFRFTRAKFRSGAIKVNVYNTLPKDLFLDYIIPNAFKGNDTLKIIERIPAAVNGVASHVYVVQDMTGWELDLRGIAPFERVCNCDINKNGRIDQDTVNTFYNIIKGGIEQSNDLIYLSLNDSIYIKGEFLGMVPDLAEGFLGNDTFSIASTFDFDNVLNSWNLSKLSLEKVDISLEIWNSIGADAAIKINKLRALNTIKNQQVDLTGLAVTNFHALNKPVKPSGSNPVIPAYTEIAINSSNSNIEKLLDIIPDRFEYDMQAFINPGKEIPTPEASNDFIYYGKSIEAKMGINIPMSIIAENMVLVDTADFSMGEVNLDQISDGILRLIIDNDFPLSAKIQVYLLDENGIKTDSLLAESGEIKAGIREMSSGRVSLPEQSIINVSLSKSKTDALSRTKKIIISATFNTKPSNSFVKIYNDYRIKVKLIGNLKYKLDKD